MESIFEQEIYNSLSCIYNVKDENNILTIFFIRYMIYYDSEIISIKKVIDFLLRELNIPNQNIIFYKGTKIYKYSYKDKCAIENIVDNMIYRGIDIITEDFSGNKIEKYKIIKAKFYRYKKDANEKLKYEKKKSYYYKERYKYIMLKQLYKDFNLKIQSPPIIKGLVYPQNHNYFELTIDEVCARFYTDYAFLKQRNNISEEYIENYIYKYKKKIDDIFIINRQVKVKSGIIDLMGEDEEGNKVVIELKNNNKPKDLLWQLKAYTQDIKEKTNKNVRSVAITPSLDKNTYNLLKEENMELYYFYINNNNNIIFKKQL